MKDRNYPCGTPDERGFTLVELSIVLVVIALIVGTIVKARSMMRQAALLSVITDINAFQQAIAQFEQKYGALPGDMANATSYWGTNPNCATGGLGTGTQTCNGNGDGIVSIATYENFYAWQHLANAGFIAGQYTGAPALAGNTAYCLAWTNCPGGKVSQTQNYFLFGNVGAGMGSSGWWVLPMGTYLTVGAPASAGYPEGGLFKPKEALMLDLKMDDGQPGTGKWMSSTPNWSIGYGVNCVVNSTNNSQLANGTAASMAVAAYNISDSNYDCALMVLPNGAY